MQVNRVFPILMLGALLVAGPTSAATGDMNVAAFLAKADKLKAKGFLALGSPDIALLQAEAKAAGDAYRKRIDNDRKQKRTPHSCPPAKTGVKSDDLIAHLRTYPAPARPSISLTTAISDLMKKRFPCR
jgi:hypothetical protein